MWFPELFNRFDEYDRHHPGQDATVCEVTNFVVNNGSHVGLCSDKIESGVFMESLITVAAALPSNIVAVLGMDRLGRKFFLGKCFSYESNSIHVLAHRTPRNVRKKIVSLCPIPGTHFFKTTMPIRSEILTLKHEHACAKVKSRILFNKRKRL